MFYKNIRPLTQPLNSNKLMQYQRDQIHREMQTLVQDEIAKIAIKSSNSPYFEDHIEYHNERYEDANEGSWKKPPAEPKDQQVAMNNAVLKQLNII